MGFLRILLGVFGVLIILVSLFFVVAALVDLMIGSKSAQPGVLIGLLILFGGTGLAGAFMARAGFRSQPVEPVVSLLEQEQRILALAKIAGGRLSLPEVALQCRLSIADSQAALDRMAAQGAAEIQVADDGSFIYLFRSFLPGDNHPQIGP